MYEKFLTVWKTADPDLPELTQAKEFLRARQRLQGLAAIKWKQPLQAN
jgi:hypothetical protein